VRQQLQLLDREEVDVLDAVQRRERARDVKPPALVKPVAVRISTHRTGEVTRVEVHGPDSPGALFRVSQILSNLETELQGALVATVGPEVRDTFFVTGVLPDDADLQVLLEPALLDTPAVA
jgi:UTP:GlnB (protein PII) uridylyltransferase